MRTSGTGTLLLAFGTVVAAPALAASGKDVYAKVCFACHDSGVANAPKFGDRAAWAPRVAVGRDALVESVLKGKGAMPPKGGASNLSKSDVKGAVEHMLSAVK